MKIIRGALHLTQTIKNCALTIGNFDGFHVGHQQLIAQLKTVADHHGIPSALITFEPQPKEFFGVYPAVPRLMRFREKIIMAQRMGIDYLIVLRFHHRLAHLPAEDFVKNILLKQCGMRHIVIGEDFHFGAYRQGDASLLKKMGQQFNFAVTEVPKVQINGERVGSTWVRKALAEGDFLLVQRLLARPFSHSGRIVEGKKLGRQLGFPTINIPLHRDLPPFTGIYAVEVNGLTPYPLKGAASIGWRPTIDEAKKQPLLEVNLFDIDAQFYGKCAEVTFLKKFRDEEHFHSLAELQQQIAEDVKNIQMYFAQKKV